MGASKRLFENLNQRLNFYNVRTNYEYELDFSQRYINDRVSEQGFENQQYKLLKN